MNDKSTILKIIRHPLIREIMENKMATSSVITRLIAEELMLNESFTKPQEIIDALKVLQASGGKIPEVASYFEKIKKGEFDKKLFRAAAMKSHPDQGGDEKTFKAISGFNGIDQNLLKQTLQQVNGGQQAQQGQGQPASQEVLASVKQVIEKYQKGYESFLQMIADLKQDPALYYTDEKIQQIYKNLGALQEEVDLNQLKDPDPKKSFEKAVKALEVVKNKILELIKSKLSDSKKQQVQEAEEKDFVAELEQIMKKYKSIYDDLKNELKPDIKKDSESLLVLLDYFRDLNEVDTGSYMKALKKFAGKNQWIQAAEQAVLGLKGSIKNIFTFGKQTQAKPEFAESLYNSMERFMKFYEQAAGIMQFAKEKSTGGELVVKTKKGDVIPVQKGDQEKVVQIFELIQDWITIYKFIITEFAEDVKALGGDPQKQLPEPAKKLLSLDKVERLLPPPQKLLPAPVSSEKPETETPPEETKPEETKPEEPPPEIIELAKDAIENYVKNFDLFCQEFLNVKTLHAQSELFRKFYATIFPIAGMNPDTIVGDQISSYTATAQPDQRITDADTNLQEAEEEQQDQKKLTKDIAQNAKTIERHANAILETLEDYEKYLKIGGTGGVKQGSRELFNKFGESDPKKLINKFVKLIVKDINAEIKIIDEMIAQAEQALQSNEQPQQASAKRDDVLTEAAVDNSVRDLPVRDKIILVIKTGKKVCEIGARLKDMIAKETKPQEKKPAEQPQQQQPGKRDDLEEAETKASDARNNPDPTGTSKDPRDLRTMGARQGDEVQIGYKELAKQIHELMTKIRPLFPTSQPFDTNYDFSVAIQTFKAALKGLSSHVAQVSGFEFDQVTSSNVLESFKNKLEAFKKVIIDVFGYSEELKDSKNQASFNQEGQKSGMPHAGEDKGKEEPEAKDPKELKEKIDKKLKEAENSIEIVRFITAQPPSTDAKANADFFKYILSTSGLIRTLQLSTIKAANKDIIRTLQKTEQAIDKEVQRFIVQGNLEANLNSLMTAIARIYYKFKDSTTQSFKENLLKEAGSQTSKISQVGKMMVKFISIYNVLKMVSEEMGTRETSEALKLTEEKIKELDGFVKEITDTFTEIQTVVKQFPINKIGKDIKVDDFYSYYHFDKFKSFGLSIDDELKAEMEKDKKKKSPEQSGTEKTEDQPQTAEEQEIEEIADELVGELVPKVSEFGSVMPKYEDPNGQLNVKDKEVSQIIDQEIENIEIPEEIKQDQGKMDDLKNKIQMKISTELEGESGDKDLKTRLSEFLDDNESSVVIKFLNALSEQGLIKEDLAGVFKNFGDSKLIKKSLRKLSPDEKGTLKAIVGDSDKRNKLLNVMGTVKKSDLSGDKEEFQSHSSEIKKAREDIKGPEDVMDYLKGDKESFPEFDELDENEQKAVSYFLTYIGDFDHTKLKEEIDPEDVFVGELTKFGPDEARIKEMIKKMKGQGIYDSFVKLFSKKKDMLKTYAENFGVQMKGSSDSEEPPKGKSQGVTAFFKEKEIEEQFTNNFKPLIREMLKKGNKK